MLVKLLNFLRKLRLEFKYWYSIKKTIDFLNRDTQYMSEAWIIQNRNL